MGQKEVGPPVDLTALRRLVEQKPTRFDLLESEANRDPAETELEAFRTMSGVENWGTSEARCCYSSPEALSETHHQPVEAEHEASPHVLSVHPTASLLQKVQKMKMMWKMEKMEVREKMERKETILGTRSEMLGKEECL